MSMTGCDSEINPSLLVHLLRLKAFLKSVIEISKSPVFSLTVIF